MKQLLSRLTPTNIAAAAVVVLAALAAFHVTLSATEQGATLAFVGAAAIVLLKYRTAESIAALVAAGIAVAVAFGLPLSSAQTESILTLAGAALAIVFGKGAVQHVAARRAARRASSDHPSRKTGRRKPKNAPALLLAELLTGIVPAHPVTVDHFLKLLFGLYGNDRFGVCGPTSVANLIRLVSAGLLGSEIQPSQDDVYDLYRRSGNPNFNPNLSPEDPRQEDNGVDMQTMLEELLRNGIGDGKGGKIKPLAFAKVNVKDDAELEAAVSIFGGVIWGVNLQTAQQAQTDATPPRWDYKRSSEWGGHAVLNGAFEIGKLEDVESWAERVQTTEAFRTNQLEEAWVVVWPWNIDHPAFQEGVDVAALAADYKALTGKELPIAPPPAPVPISVASEADIALWEKVKDWATNHRHTGAARSTAISLIAWARSIGLS
jgi:hypothetical protein